MLRGIHHQATHKVCCNAHILQCKLKPALHFSTLTIKLLNCSLKFELSPQRNKPGFFEMFPKPYDMPTFETKVLQLVGNLHTYIHTYIRIYMCDCVCERI